MFSKMFSRSVLIVEFVPVEWHYAVLSMTPTIHRKGTSAAYYMSLKPLFPVFISLSFTHPFAFDFHRKSI